jgi:hypothetical protein
MNDSLGRPQADPLNAAAAIRGRRSIRRFLNTPVDRSTILRLLDLAAAQISVSLAPVSTCTCQGWVLTPLGAVAARSSNSSTVSRETGLGKKRRIERRLRRI